MKTQVAIVGAGPAGLMLSRLLQLSGISSVVLERHDRGYIERRVRAGVLEQTSVDLLDEAGVSARLHREGQRHEGIFLQFDGERHRLALTELTGRAITVYGQQEVVKDLVACRVTGDSDLVFEVSDVALRGLAADAPLVEYVHEGRRHEVACDFVVGCDGSHGVCRSAVPAGATRVYERTYPFAWLGILAKAPPATHELIYSLHERGFALYSMRSAQLSRLYLQVAQDENVACWSDARVWDELHARLESNGSWAVTEGEVLEKVLTPLHSHVVEPMQWRRLFFAGDAVHVVPPTGAKGMNLALADAKVLADAFALWYRGGRRDLLDAYSQTALRRVWRAQHFSWWMTSMLHRVDDDFERRLQLAQLRFVTTSPAYARSLADNYVGLAAV